MKEASLWVRVWRFSRDNPKLRAGGALWPRYSSFLERARRRPEAQRILRPKQRRQFVHPHSGRHGDHLPDRDRLQVRDSSQRRAGSDILDLDLRDEAEARRAAWAALAGMMEQSA